MIDRRKAPPLLKDLTPIQAKYLNDNKHRFFIVPSGRRSRKTLISKFKVIIHNAFCYPDTNYFLGAPTYAQAKNIFWNDLKKYTHYFQKSKSETDLSVVLINNTMVKVFGLDKPERLEGVPWNGCLIDECGNVKEQAWSENIRPVLSDTNGFALLTGVPEGRNWYYDLALYAAGGFIPESKPIIGSFAENPNDKQWCYYHWFSGDVLDDQEIEAAKRELDERTFRQEYQGSFEAYQGLAYWTFSDKNIADINYNLNEHVHVGMDFNRNPMTATLCHIKNDVILQFDEIYLNQSNTYEMVEALKDRFYTDQVTIYPDSTGKAESSNATMSDISILTKAGFKVRAKSINPRQRDRINAVNSKIMPSNGEVKYFVDSKCVKTINDLNKVEALDDGRLNKDLEKQGLVHITDALGYMIAFLFPVKNLKARAIDA